MLQKLAGNQISRYIQLGTNALAVVFLAGWIAFIGYVLLQGAYEVAGMFVLFTLLVGGVAYANARSD